MVKLWHKNSYYIDYGLDNFTELTYFFPKVVLIHSRLNKVIFASIAEKKIGITTFLNDVLFLFGKKIQSFRPRLICYL